MSARFMTAYLISVGLVAGIISQALAKPPDLPAKVQITCEKSSEKMVLKTYQVADLVIPVEGLPEGLPWAEVALPMVAPWTPPSAPYAAVPTPMPAPAILPPPAASGSIPPPVGYGYPPPFGFVPLPAVPPPEVYPSPVPTMPSVTKHEATKSTKTCCPACASALCTGCPSDSCCQCPACVAAGCCVPPQAQAPQKTLEDRLIRLIVSTVKPESWDVNGGHGTIDFFPLGFALTVNQTPDVQEQIANLLVYLHRLQDEEIAVEVRVISVPQGFGEKVVGKVGGKVAAGEAKGQMACFSDEFVRKLMEDLQANPKTNVMMVPKVTVFNGQAANVQINEQQFFVTNVKMIRQGEQQFFIPENHPFSTGFRFSVKPTVSADHRFIQMGLEVEEKVLDTLPDKVPLFPITTVDTPLYEGGAKGQPVPFTCYLQQPSLLTQRVHQEVCVPCGQTALFKTWTRCNRVPDESQVPILSWLPYIGRLFNTVSYHEETADVWVMVTPRLIINQTDENRVSKLTDSPPTVTDNLQKLTHARALYEQAEHCRRMGQPESAQHIYEKVQELCPGSRYAQLAARRLNHLPVHQAARAPESVTPRPMLVSEYMKLRNTPEFKRDQEVSDYLSQYWRACAEGRTSEAVQWAVQALALDPACFTKAHDANWQRVPGKNVTPSAN